jgi:hypothetical protein
VPPGVTVCSFHSWFLFLFTTPTNNTDHRCHHGLSLWEHR